MNYLVNKYCEDRVDLALSEFEISKLMAEQDRLTNLKVELRNPVNINKELIRQQSEISIAKSLGPMILIGIILWLLTFSLINHLI